MAQQARRLARRMAAVSLSAAALVTAVAGPALADGGAPVPDAAYYRAHLVEITPQLPGITANVDPHAEWIELTYTGPGQVVIYGYTHEPYLRITAAGLAENQLSPATYINRSMFADLPTGTATTPADAPAWHPVAATHTARWHDHRIHWMGQARPPAVAADPSHPHLVGNWVVHAVADRTPFELRGTLNWIGKPGRLTTRVWLLLAAGNLPLIGGVAVWYVRWERRRTGVAG
jgi:hypothetical protein